MADGYDLVQHQMQTGGTLDEVQTPLEIRSCHPQVSHFGDATVEYQAAVNSCAMFDLTDRTQLEIRGTDAQSFLHKFCTNNIERLEPGGGCEAFITNIKGRILAHVFAFVTDDAVWLDSPPAEEEALLSHLDRYLFSEDVRLDGRSEAFGDFYLVGSKSADKLTDLEICASSLSEMQHTMSSVAGVPVAVRRVAFWNRPGFLISADRQQHVKLWQQLVAAGIQPAGAQAFHALRIQSTFPIYGIDLSADNLAQEAGRTEQAISFTKGCYLGQEPIARIDAIGHINRQLTGLRLERVVRPAATATINADDGTRVGSVTSSMVVPGQQQTVVLAMLKTSHSHPGTSLFVQTDEGPIAAQTF